MRVLALDIAGRTGYVLGDLSARPQPKILSLAAEGKTADDAAARFGLWLRDVFESPNRPASIVVERNLAGSAQKGGHASEMTMKLHGALTAVAACYRIPIERVAASTARKSFTGRGTYPSREDAKRASVKAAQFHGFLDKFDNDNDKADAAGLFFWLGLQRGIAQKRLQEAIPF